MRRIIGSLLLLVIWLLPQTALAYSSNICSSSTCSSAEVGIIMDGISANCGNLGTCELTDILIVFANVGNWISGIIGVVVLMMYVIGGFYFLISAGNDARVQKGKDYMRISTIGLLIVMFAYLGIYTLRGVLQTGDAYIYVGDEYVTCTDVETDGKPCDLNSVCVDGACTFECHIRYPTATLTETSVTYHDCIDTSITDGLGDGYEWGGCVTGLCPGGDEMQCCQIQKDL